MKINTESTGPTSAVGHFMKVFLCVYSRKSSRDKTPARVVERMHREQMFPRVDVQETYGSEVNRSFKVNLIHISCLQEAKIASETCVLRG